MIGAGSACKMAINQAQFFDLLTEYRRKNWHGIQTPEWQQKIIASMIEESRPAILTRIAPYWKLPSDPLILDLGSGVGNFVIGCRNQGYRAFGVEPDRIGQGSSLTSLQIAAKRVDVNVFAAATGEQLPFRDSMFDLVVLDQVIEHVQDQNAVLAEALRVVKPSGAIYVACPNYLRFYEPHYKLWFVPLMLKFVGSLYLRLRRRDPVLLGQLTYTTNWRVRRLLARLNARFVDLNESGFVSKCTSQTLSTTKKARLVRTLTKIPIVSRFVPFMASFYVRVREGGSEFLIFREA